MSAVHPLIQGILEAHGAPPARPDEPAKGDSVWYRGWECGWYPESAYWGFEPFTAAKGGWDLDCKQTSGRSWTHLLDEIDDEEDEQ